MKFQCVHVGKAFRVSRLYQVLITCYLLLSLLTGRPTLKPIAFLTERNQGQTTSLYLFHTLLCSLKVTGSPTPNSLLPKKYLHVLIIYHTKVFANYSFPSASFLPEVIYLEGKGTTFYTQVSKIPQLKLLHDQILIRKAISKVFAALLHSHSLFLPVYGTSGLRLLEL